MLVDKAMTNRERFINTMEYKAVDRVPNYEVGVWGQTIDRWEKEGLNIYDLHWDWFTGEEFFDMDAREYIDVNYGMMPAFQAEILERTERYEVIRHSNFMTGAGGGQSFGMLGGFNTMFGNPAPHVENGQLSHPMFNGVQEKFIAFLNELNNAGVLAPDWYTIEWEQAKAYTHGDKLGMVWYPAGSLLAEYTNAKNKTLESVDVWTYWKEPPIEGGKYPATGNPGYTWCFTKQGFTDEGKLKRVAHMLDTMVIGGENFFHTIQGGTNEVFEAMGIKVETPRECVYNDDGTFYIYNEDGFPWRQEDGYSPIGIWQHFGLSVIWQRNAPKGATEFDKKHNETANRLNDIILSYDRWPNDSLKINVAINEIAPNLSDFEKAQELAFVTGKRPMSEWSKYQQEWLDKGGREVIKAIADNLNVLVPDYAN